MKTNIARRIYNLTDAELMQKVDGLILLLNRDLSELSAYGLSQPDLLKFQQDNEAFKGIKADHVLRAEGATATGNKNMSADELRVIIRAIRVRVMALKESFPGLYDEFSLGILNNISSNELYRIGRNVLNKLTQYKEQLASTGIDDAFISQFETKLKTLDDQLDVQFQTEFSRNLATEIRCSAGNSLYKRLANWSAYGKDMWYSRNEAKYNDYVIYEVPPAVFGKLMGNITAQGSGNPVVRALLQLDHTDYFVVTDAQGNYVIDDLPDGDYTATVTADNFQEYSKSGITVSKNSTTIENIVLIPLQG